MYNDDHLERNSPTRATPPQSPDMRQLIILAKSEIDAATLSSSRKRQADHILRASNYLSEALAEAALPSPPQPLPPTPEKEKWDKIAAEIVDGLKLRGIQFCEDLCAEDTPWESVAEPEPQYFTTFLEAYDFQIKLAESATPEPLTAKEADPHVSLKEDFDVGAVAKDGDCYGSDNSFVSHDAARQERHGQINIDDPATWPEIGKWPKEPADVPDDDDSPQYPKPCGICGGVIQSKTDLDWHGYGNCRDIPEPILKFLSLPPLAEFLRRDYRFSTQDDQAEAMRMGQEIAEGVLQWRAAPPLAPQRKEK
jgi:hypothetical protein